MGSQSGFDESTERILFFLIQKLQNMLGEWVFIGMKIGQVVAPMFENVRKVHEALSSQKIIFTEGCVEKFDAKKYQFWANGERYGTSMINDFNNGTVGWTDWNILLDQNGGPNHVGNFCFAPIHADTNTGELIYTPSYYYIGHFSKFIRPRCQKSKYCS